MLGTRDLVVIPAVPRGQPRELSRVMTQPMGAGAGRRGRAPGRIRIRGGSTGPGACAAVLQAVRHRFTIEVFPERNRQGGPGSSRRTWHSLRPERRVRIRGFVEGGSTCGR